MVAATHAPGYRSGHHHSHGADEFTYHGAITTARSNDGAPLISHIAIFRGERVKEEVNTALELIEGGKADDTTAIIAELASRGEWDSIYFLSASAGRELSVLFDAET